jgi:DNA polymerase III delta prime subunit
MHTKSRTMTFHKYKKYEQHADTRTMDDLCMGESDFQLQVQQKFMKDWMNKEKSWRNLLLYHNIGSGKTCTGITMAEEYLRQNPSHKVKVILPARLRSNFFDELISPCGMNAYISRADFIRYHDSSTSATSKRKLRSQFMKAIQDKYEIMSFEKFRASAIKAHNLKQWVEMFTHNSLVIIDEVHNLISMKYKMEQYKEMEENRIIPKKIIGINTVVFKYMLSHASKSCKFILMTATPVFDNIRQFKDLVSIMNPTLKIDENTTLKHAIDGLRGMVSYFPGTSPNAYPNVSYETHRIPMSKLQEDLIVRILAAGDEENDEYKESFLAKQRQVSIACLEKNANITEKNISKVIANQDKYAPKVKALVNEIDTLKGKHMIYSNFIEKGLKIVEAALRKKGWISISDVQKKPELGAKHEYKVYALWDGSIKDVEKQMIKSVINHKSNLDGKYIRLILGSPSVKEGVSFKHMQHLHMLDPVWNQSAKTQVEGRAIRFCSHIDVPKDHAFLKREVKVHIYVIKPRSPAVEITADEFIYDKVIPNKKQMVEIAENALKTVAVDHFLFRKLYKNNGNNTPPVEQENYNKPSVVNIPEDVPLNMRPKGKEQKRNTCPSKRRPDKKNGLCPEGMEKKLNKHGQNCCYVVKNIKKKQEQKGCPKPRRPINGDCPDGFEVKPNKYGNNCCYKVT